MMKRNSALISRPNWRGLLSILLFTFLSSNLRSEVVIIDPNGPVHGLPAPLNLFISADSNQQFTISWTSGGGDTVGFYLAFAAGVSPTDCKKGIKLGLVESYTRSDLSPNSTYTVTVCAYDAHGKVSTNVNATQTTLANSGFPPPAPYNMNVWADSSTQLTASWISGGASTAGFWIAFAPGNTIPICSNGIRIGLNESYTRTGMNPSGTFTVSVCAYDADGNVSDAVNGTVTMPGNLGQAPPAPYNMNVWADSSTQLSTSWRSGGGNTVGFWIAFAAGNTIPTCSNGIQIGSKTSYTRTGMNPNATFTVSVCAYDSEGNVSGQVSGTVTMPGNNGGNAPPAPTDLFVSADSSTQLTASWTSGGRNTKGFWIAFGVGPAAPVCSNGIQIGLNETYSRSGMDPNRTFYVSVCAYDAKGNVSPQVSGSVTMPSH